MRYSALKGIILAVSVLGAGCSTTSPFSKNRLALPTGPSYVGGRGMQMFPTSPVLLTNVKDAMSEMNMHALVQTEDPSGLIIIDAKTHDDQKIRTTIQSSGANSTVSIRVGWVGDETLTRGLLDRIASKQGVIPSQPGAKAPAPQPTAPPLEEDEKQKSPGLFSRSAVPDDVMLRDQIANGVMPAFNR